MIWRFPSTSAACSAAGSFCICAAGRSCPTQRKSAQWNSGAYLVNGPGHCAECHSPRNLLGGIIESERFAGGPTPDGKGWVPNITPAGLGNRAGNVAWSEKDIASFLGDGMNPAGDFAGGAMAEVIQNTSLLRPEDRAAIANYIASLPPVQGPDPAAEEAVTLAWAYSAVSTATPPSG